MPETKVELRENGEYGLDLETGEKYQGKPEDVLLSVGKSKVDTRRHYEAKEAELKKKEDAVAAREEALRQQNTVAQPVTQPANQQEADFQKYLLEQTARGLGYNNADEYRAQLQKVVATTGEMENQRIAGDFLTRCQDFPNTPEAIAELSKKLDENKWDYTPQSMIAAHSLCLREDKYKPLSADEQNASWANQMQAANRPTPPPMIRSGSPDSQPKQDDAWSMPLDQLRKAALTQQK